MIMVKSICIDKGTKYEIYNIILIFWNRIIGNTIPK